MMGNTFPTVSIIIATFNSERTLPKTLESARQQTCPQEEIEILVVDGGSRDSTIEIARKHGCRVIVNPRTEPVYGKFLGYLSARGRYIMYLDADEIIENREGLSKKIKTFESDRRIKVVVGTGYKSPEGYPFVNQYINDFGDPFTFFVYRLSKDSRFFMKTMRSRYPISSECQDYVVFDLSGVSNLPLLELAAGGSMFDAKALKREFPETTKRPELVTQFFYLLHSVYPNLAITKEDCLVHYSSRTITEYLTKIVWRIKNNVFHSHSMGDAGYLGRERYLSNLGRLGKLIFLPYGFSIVFPLIDATYLAIARRNASYFLHIFLVLFVATAIVYYYLLRILGYHPVLKSYDESKEVGW